jgi:hypothetical protein
MNSLLTELLQWLHNNNYRRASFDRIISIVPSASNYEQLTQLINDYSHIFRAASIKGGLPGLAVQDDIEVCDALDRARGSFKEEDAEPMTTGYAIDPPATCAPAPTHVTPAAILEEIVSTHYRNLGSALKQVNGPTANVTLCVLVLRNDFVIIGKSACVDSANYDEEIGQRLAYEDAVKQVWPYLGFRLADRRLAA